MRGVSGTEQINILVPYKASEDVAAVQDIFVYLRPETNGMLTESVLFGVLRGSKTYSSHTRMVYLANIPGEFLVEHRIVEEHYRLKLEFARKGRELFTPSMIERFEARFKEDFDRAPVLGAFQFIERTGMDEEELFNIWVDESDFMVLNGQTVKHWKGMYIVNYDIPALLHRSSCGTDIAVFLLRSTLSSREFRDMIRDMEASLRVAGILEKNKPSSRVFHYSKGPFEQLLDAKGFLYNPDGSHVPLEKLSFYRFLTARGVTKSNIEGILDYPIMMFPGRGGKTIEENVFTYTAGMSYAEAFQAITGN